MDFELSEDHLMFRKAIRDFAEKEVAPLVDEAEREQKFPRQLFRRLGDLGYLCMRYPEDYGGAGADKITECLYAEELGKVGAGIASALIAHASLGTSPIFEFGTPEQKQKYLLPAARGEKVACFGLTEPNAGSDVSSLETSARLDGDSYVLNGTKMFITNAPICDYIVAAATVDKKKGVGGIGLFIVDRGTAGFNVSRKLEKMGLLSSETGEVVFEDCRVPRENLIGGEEGGFKRVLATLTGSRVVVGARAVGIAKAAYEAALRYAKERVQFGQPIGKFQANRFKLAEMAIEIDAAELLVYRAAWLHIQGRPYVKEAAMAKLYATEMVLRVTHQALQLHGGYGYMREYPVERYYRDARVGTIVEGTSEIQHTIIAKEIGL